MSKIYFGRFKVKREPGKGVLWLVIGIVSEICWAVPYVGWIIGLTGGMFFIFFGMVRRRRKLFERFLQYGEKLGMRDRIPMAELAQVRHGDVNGTRDEIRRMLSMGYFGEGACIDDGDDSLVVPLPYTGADDMPKAEPACPKFDYADEMRRVLDELDSICGKIRDQGVKCRINRISQLTEGIFRAVIDRPERENDVRRFVNYYLPTTMKLLNSYELLEEQSAQGENIAASRAKIEDVLNRMIGAYEQQLDRLFGDDALDIAAEIDVLEKMMSGDGLSEKKGINLTL